LGVALAAANERAVRASIVSTGLNGGELFLEAIPDNIPGKPFENLKTGQWIMVCGPHPNSNVVMSDPPVGEARFVLNWYQVLTIESERNDIISDPVNQRLVAVRGPQWPWLPTTGAMSNSNNELSNQLCAGIFRGAVAVHSKTIRLEGENGGGLAHVKP
jgi:hypothetical protein